MNRVLKAKSKDVFAIMECFFDCGKTAWIVVSGMSMYPFLREDFDMVELTRASFSKIEKGDIVLIKRFNNEFVLHRVINKDKSGFYIIGDAQQWVEGPILEDQLKAVAINIRRKQKITSCNSYILKTLVHLWLILIPIRYKLIRVINFVEKIYYKLKGRMSD